MTVLYTAEERRQMDVLAGSKKLGELLTRKIDGAAERTLSFEQNFADHSVNQSKTKLGIDGELVFIADKKNTGQVAGNFNGGGSGNKPIVGIKAAQSLVGKKLSEIDLVISQDVELRTEETSGDGDEDRLGVSYNLLVDLEGNGNEADYRVIDITNTLNGFTDKWGETGASASVDDFNIKDDVFWIVLGLSGSDFSWTSTQYTLSDVTTPHPNATVISVVSWDGGHPAGEKMAALTAQTGGSGNSLRMATAITRLEINGKKLI